jgi:predicted phage tail protein
VSKQELQLLGVFMLIGGVFMIVRNKEHARRYEEARKGRRCGHWEFDYVFWRIVNIFWGTMLAVLGALLILGFGIVQP